jgi:hypothetical protein
MRCELDDSEKAACEIARRVLDVHIEPWDVYGRVNADDALLHYPDGRIAAFEVSKLAADRALQLDSLLERDDFSWPLPGRWWWTISIPEVRYLPRVKADYKQVVLWCEQNQVTRPHRLRPSAQLPAEVAWIATSGAATMTGHPDVPIRDGDMEHHAMVVPAGAGGGSDLSLAGLDTALSTALATTHLRDRVQKLRSTEVDVAERHLFIPLHRTALPFPIAYGLIVGAALPSAPPPLPWELTHLWLAPQFGKRVLLGTADGWSQHQPYDG